MSEKVIGFTCGAFDCFHIGHLQMLREAKNNCDHLIVGLHATPTHDRPNTKQPPHQRLFERHLQLLACSYIDEIVVYETEDDLLQLLTVLPIDIRFLGADYIGRTDFTGSGLEIPIHYNKRSHDYSSTSERNKRTAVIK